MTDEMPPREVLIARIVQLCCTCPSVPPKLNEGLPDELAKLSTDALVALSFLLADLTTRVARAAGKPV